jgi:hypothetical protein
MSKPKRSIQEINNEYFRRAAELGDLEWKYEKIPGQMETIKNMMKQLDAEMDRAQAWEAMERQEKLKSGQNVTADLNSAPEAGVEASPTP